MTNYLDIAYELNKLEELSDTYEIQRIINQIQLKVMSDDVNWNECFIKMVEVAESIAKESYVKGWYDCSVGQMEEGMI
ncbi:hypothetical protein M3649_03600 [Ureibacillus chungkukjangi]|uniref:hypothetical protein n=1 Tax=Ureibacillus chungkukjangi TaxID=1202712 RepID=UPI0020412049|nr:hypothetical protein [Ureibacillus chungkukjangi]MCM3387215.1 hypothetical protein [Ureibacillus chungkukjangi]